MQDTGQIIDALTDRKPIWSVKDGDTQPTSDWLKPLPPEGEPVPAPTPVPVPDPTPAPVPVPVPVPVPPVDLTPILKALVALGQQVDTLQDQIQELASKPDPVVKVPPVTFPKYSGSIFGVRITLTPEK